MQEISICLSDIPKDKIYTSKNNKKYLSITVVERKEKDKFDNDLTIYCKQTKEEREAKTTKVYIGSGKTVNFKKHENYNVNNDVQEVQAEVIENDGLPF